jgi:hypothetical protein
MRRQILASCLAAGILALALARQAEARQFSLFGSPLNLFGFASQSAQVSLKGDHYDVEEGLNQALLTAFAEADYRPRNDTTFYVSGLLTMDLIYDIKHDDRTWNEKLFSQSRGRMYLDDRDWQFLKECHVTWSPGSFLFRIGKQIVKWGETDGIRLMDQNNPADSRRGLADVEFETTIIPIWLLRTEYFVQPQTSWLTDLGVEFIFNPNADFRGNEPILPGNDVSGIWAPNISITHPALGFCHVGSYDIVKLDEPDAWDPDTFQYGVRLKGIVADAIVTLNYFNGRDNQPILKNKTRRDTP